MDLVWLGGTAETLETGLQITAAAAFVFAAGRLLARAVRRGGRRRADWLLPVALALFGATLLADTAARVTHAAALIDVAGVSLVLGLVALLASLRSRAAPWAPRGIVRARHRGHRRA